MKILIMNGPNLNLLGVREPKIYGTTPFETHLASLRTEFPSVEFDYYQSNVEGFLIDRLQQAMTDCTDGIVLNAGALTHTSVALLDALRTLNVPVVEVHISNVAAREDFRHRSLIAPACAGSISGFGLKSYDLAVRALTEKQ